MIAIRKLCPEEGGEEVRSSSAKIMIFLQLSVKSQASLRAVRDAREQWERRWR